MNNYDKLNQLAENILGNFYKNINEKFGEEAREINGLYHSISDRKKVMIPTEIEELTNNLNDVELVEQLKRQPSLALLILLFYTNKLENDALNQLICGILANENDEKQLLFLSMIPSKLSKEIIDMVYLKLTEKNLVEKYTFGEKDYRYHLLKRSELHDELKQELISSYQDVSEEYLLKQLEALTLDRTIKNRRINLYKEYGSNELNLAKFDYECSKHYLHLLKLHVHNHKVKVK